MKRKAAVLSGAILFFCVLFIWRKGGALQYIPFTEEYDDRRYRKAYEKVSGDFASLQKELAVLCGEVTGRYGSGEAYSSVIFSRLNGEKEWSVQLDMAGGTIEAGSAELSGGGEIERINRQFGEELLFIVYQKNEYFQYNIGEYVRIRISAAGGKAVINGK